MVPQRACDWSFQSKVDTNEKLTSSLGHLVSRDVRHLGHVVALEHLHNLGCISKKIWEYLKLFEVIWGIRPDLEGDASMIDSWDEWPPFKGF